MSIFRFQKFSIQQKKSAMKVCTDATLFGAMAPVKTGDRVLDIGTGTGLLALMVAQLGASHVTGVELTKEACSEAGVNFHNSPWHQRLQAVHGPIQSFANNTPERYDLIISNPPFFHKHSKASNFLRSQARHTDPLSYEELLACVDELLAKEGLFYLLLPCHATQRFTQMALECELHLIDKTNLRGYSHTATKISALTFSREMRDCSFSLLTIHQSERIYTKESERYLSPFLLRFA